MLQPHELTSAAQEVDRLRRGAPASKPVTALCTLAWALESDENFQDFQNMDPYLANTLRKTMRELGKDPGKSTEKLQELFQGEINNLLLTKNAPQEADLDGALEFCCALSRNLPPR